MAPKLTRKQRFNKKNDFLKKRKMSRDEDKAQNPKDYSGTQLRSTEEDPTAQKLTSKLRISFQRRCRDAMRKVVRIKTRWSFEISFETA